MNLTHLIKPIIAITLLFSLSFIHSLQRKNGLNLLDKKSFSMGSFIRVLASRTVFKGEQPKDESGNLIEPVGYNKKQE